MSFSAYAQNTFNYTNTVKIVALVKYERYAPYEFYKRKENVNVASVFNEVNIYAYNKKTRELYLTAHDGNYLVTLDEATAKQVKKNKLIPQLKENEINDLVEQKNKEVDDVYSNKNRIIQQEKEDSIAQARKDSIMRAKRDSIKRVEDSLKFVAEKAREQEYISSHKWYGLNLKKIPLYCSFCEESYNDLDSVFCYGIQNDTIYWAGRKYGRMGIPYRHIHASSIPGKLKNDFDFNYHRRLFNDSLTTRLKVNNELVSVINSDYYFDYLKTLKREAPNGLFLEWGWDNEFSIEFNFTYLNTNKKTIKYIEVFWVLKNDVGDVRRTGSFRGTGPLEEFESARWSWDHSHYYAAGDASKMSLSKVLITYMDGSRVTIPKNKICYD